MKRYKRVITTAITAAMAMACVNMSAGAAFAQTGQFETGTYGAAVAEDIHLHRRQAGIMRYHHHSQSRADI